MYRSKILSSFEIVSDYSPSIIELKKSTLSECLLNLYKEQVEDWKFRELENTRKPRSLDKADLRTDQCVYYFTKGTGIGKWHKVFVRQARDHVDYLTSNLKRQGHQIAAAREDTELVPETP